MTALDRPADEPVDRAQWTRWLPTVTDTESLGAELGRRLGAGDLVVLSGPLGAGKTVLVRGIAAGLGVRGTVTSPTFVIARVHAAGARGVPLVHVDAYRLGGVGGPARPGPEPPLVDGGVAGAGCAGIAIGGSLGPEKAQMRGVLGWSLGDLPEGAPPPLLGIGAVDDAPEPVQRFGLGDLGGLARQAVPQLPSMPESLPEELPSLDNLTERARGERGQEGADARGGADAGHHLARNVGQPLPGRRLGAPDRIHHQL